MNYDIIFNVALYLSSEDLKQFLLVNKNLIEDEYFWTTKFIIDNILLIDGYSAKEYFKICRCKRNVKYILLINEIESTRKQHRTDGYITVILPENIPKQCLPQKCNDIIPKLVDEQFFQKEKY